jgi:glycosyltransferase involved in cell wall biosynthesis
VIIGLDAPLPPAPTGVAEYAEALLAALRRRATVATEGHAGVWLYHLGNNQLHAATYLRALERPGVIVLHDAVLTHFFLGSLGEPEFVAEFTYNYGAWHEPLARELYRRRARSAGDPEYFRWPMLRRVVERSRAVVVHNPAAARLVRRHVPGARVVELPLPFFAPPPPDGHALAAWRSRHGVAPGALLVAVLGYLRESKRLMPVLRAYQRARAAGAHLALLVAGEMGSEDLARAAAPLLESPGVVRLAHTPPREFRLLCEAADVCVNLRYPSAGETSGITTQMMGFGKTVLVTAGEETARYPDDCCLRVEPGLGEEEALAAYFTWLAGAPRHARAMGRRAAAYIAAEHNLDAVAARYLEELAA